MDKADLKQLLKELQGSIATKSHDSMGVLELAQLVKNVRMIASQSKSSTACLTLSRN